MSYAVFLSTVLFAVYINGDLDLIIKKYDKCDVEKTYPIKHSAHFLKINSSATITTFELIVPFKLDETVTVDILHQVFQNGEWKTVASIVGKDPCMLLNKFAGDLWFDFQSVVKLPRGKCPIPKGDYSAKKYMLDYSKLPIKYVRKSFTRTYLKLRNNENELLMCHYAIVDIL